MSQSLVFESIDMQGVRGVLIDLDNTFYEYAPCHKEGLKASYELYSKTQTINEEAFYILYKQAQGVVKQRIPHHGASHSRLLYFQNITERLEKKTNMKVSLELEEAYWTSFLKAVVLREEVVIFLQQCKEKSIKICVVTDLTTSIQLRKMITLGLDTLVDFVVTSEEVGLDKPSKAMFSVALEKLNLKKEEVIMIGDDIKKDIDGARTQNIKAYLI